MLDIEREFLSLDELKKISGVDFQPEVVKKAALFAALTGLRFSDLCKLTWAEIRHNTEAGYFIKFRQQKTKSLEVLPISEEAFLILGDRGASEDQALGGLTRWKVKYYLPKLEVMPKLPKMPKLPSQFEDKEEKKPVRLFVRSEALTGPAVELPNLPTRYGKRFLSARQSENVADIRRGTPIGNFLEAAYSGSSDELRKAFIQIRKRTAFTHLVSGQPVPLDNKNFPQIDPGTNKFVSGQGYQYDNSGNITQDAENRQFIYNGDGKQIEVKNLNLPTNDNTVGKYFYDGEGRRVKKVTNSETTIFVYDASGRLVAEYSNQIEQNPTTNYTLTDTLQSVRVVTDKNGSIVLRRDFKPFGEEVAADGVIRTSGNNYSTNNMTRVRQRFTGYQKDSETLLDFAEARYYNNLHGRFTAADPLSASGISANPQSFNRYTYTMNRPLKLTDPSGLQNTSTDRSTVQKSQDVKSTVETFTGKELKADWIVDVKNPDSKVLQVVRIDLDPGAASALNNVGIEAEQLIVAQRENAERAIEYGREAQNQIRRGAVSDDISEATGLGLASFGGPLGTLAACYINGGPPGYMLSEEQVAGMYTDQNGQLNLPSVGTSTTTTLSHYLGAESSTTYSYTPGDLAVMFQNAANTDLGLLNSMRTDEAARKFAETWATAGITVYFNDGTKITYHNRFNELNLLYIALYWERLRAGQRAATLNTTDTKPRAL